MPAACKKLSGPRGKFSDIELSRRSMQIFGYDKASAPPFKAILKAKRKLPRAI